MAIILPGKFALIAGELIIEIAKPEEAEKIIAFVKAADSETGFLKREAGEFGVSAEEESKYIAAKRDNPREIFLTAKLDGDIVGSLGFTAGPGQRYRHKGEFGIAVARKFWHCGIGSRLIESMLYWADRSGFARISLEVDANNGRAIRLYQKYGFEPEGILKFNKRQKNGVYVDAIIMARINRQNLKA